MYAEISQSLLPHLVLLVELRQEAEVVVVPVGMRTVPTHHLHLIARRGTPCVVVLVAVRVSRSVAVAMAVSAVVVVAAGEGLVEVLVPAALVRQVPREVRDVAQSVRAPLAHCVVQHGQDRGT